jgi:hypothetical protein
VTRKLPLWPFKIRQVQVIDDGDYVRIISFFFSLAVCDGLFDLKLTFYTDEAQFHLGGYISAQSSSNLRQTFEVLLDQNIDA